MVSQTFVNELPSFWAQNAVVGLVIVDAATGGAVVVTVGVVVAGVGLVVAGTAFLTAPVVELLTGVAGLVGVEVVDGLFLAVGTGVSLV